MCSLPSQKIWLFRYSSQQRGGIPAYHQSSPKKVGHGRCFRKVRGRPYQVRRYRPPAKEQETPLRTTGDETSIRTEDGPIHQSRFAPGNHSSYAEWNRIITDERKMVSSEESRRSSSTNSYFFTDDGFRMLAITACCDCNPMDAEMRISSPGKSTRQPRSSPTSRTGICSALAAPATSGVPRN
jgi:hypothetical protein